MLSPEQVGICRMCHRVVARLAGGPLLDSHKDTEECCKAESLVQYIDKWTLSQCEIAADHAAQETERGLRESGMVIPHGKEVS